MNTIEIKVGESYIVKCGYATLIKILAIEITNTTIFYKNLDNKNHEGTRIRKDEVRDNWLVLECLGNESLNDKLYSK